MCRSRVLLQVALLQQGGGSVWRQDSAGRACHHTAHFLRLPRMVCMAWKDTHAFYIQTNPARSLYPLQQACLYTYSTLDTSSAAHVSIKLSDYKATAQAMWGPVIIQHEAL